MTFVYRAADGTEQDRMLRNRLWLGVAHRGCVVVSDAGLERFVGGPR